MGQKHSKKYSLKNGGTNRHSTEINDEVAFPPTASTNGRTASDEPVAVCISTEKNDYIQNAATEMAKVWTDNAEKQKIQNLKEADTKIEISIEKENNSEPKEEQKIDVDLLENNKIEESEIEQKENLKEENICQLIENKKEGDKKEHLELVEDVLTNNNHTIPTDNLEQSIVCNTGKPSEI
uniref:Uncharacterized protein n=1 Tax=Meloidogyne javanica TaxID=6303 RepID=A0A915MGD6_MELJA